MVDGLEKADGERIIPALRYANAQKAIDWLCKAFGFKEKMVVRSGDDRIAHAELTMGNAMIMLGDAESEYGGLVRPPKSPERVNTQGIYVVITNVDDHYARAKAAGAEIVLDLKTQDYGGRDYTCRDLEGHIWTFGTYDPWVS
jgi:uncharacterized glyoxalase superfamily protein PhnB